MNYKELFDEGARLLKNGEFDKAIPIWFSIFNRFADGGPCAANLAICLIQKNRFQEAAYVLLKTIPKADSTMLPQLQTLLKQTLDHLTVTFNDHDVIIGTNKRPTYNLKDTGELELFDRIKTFDIKIVIDAGANVGEWSKSLLLKIPDAHIHAFEIVESTFEKLDVNLGECSNVTLNNIGLSDAEGLIDIHLTDVSDEVSSHYKFWPIRETIKCKVISGDSYANNNGIKEIDFLKIDVEGLELMVLKGFDFLLENKKIRLIMFEYGNVNILSHHLLYDFYKLLAKRGYLIGLLAPTGRVRFNDYSYDNENFLGPNYVACLSSEKALISALSKDTV